MPTFDLSQITDQRTRAYLYRVLVAVAPALIVYGVASQLEVALWLGVASAVLGLGTAAYNTPTKPQ